MKSLVFLGLIAILLVSGCSSNNLPPDAPVKHSSYDLPIDSRDFFLGVVPTPRNIPETTWDDIVSAYNETGDIADISMVWTGTNIGQTEKLNQTQAVTGLKVYGIRVVLNLNFATIKEIPGEGLKYVIDAPEGVEPSLSDPEFRRLWTEEAESLASEFKPDYMSLGNEINDYFYLHPEELDAYLSLLGGVYSAVKEASPKTKIMVVFSLTHLIDNDQWDMLSRFEDSVDAIGLTTYPWKHFDDPKDISQDYYTRIEQHTSKPIAFTEIGWTSSQESGSSEEEQSRFLLRFLELTKDLDIEMVNWLFLHEPELTGIVASVTSPETSTISLKNRDGSRKDIYGLWLDLKAVPERL
jgi:hypothetical protein